MNRYQKAVNEWLTNQALSHDSSVLQASFELPNYLSDVMQQLTAKQQDEALISALDDVRQIRSITECSKRKEVNHET